jgi:hypothetical protein
MPLFRRSPQPSPDEGLTLTDALLQGTEMLQQTTAAHVNRWGLGTAQRWDLDAAGGVLRWTFPERVAEAPVQVLGSYSTQGASWMWAWANDSLPSNLCSASAAVRSWGERQGHSALTTPVLHGLPEEQVAELTAIAFRITEATGFYRAPAGQSLLYTTFGSVVITTDDGRSESFSIDVG